MMINSRKIQTIIQSWKKQRLGDISVINYGYTAKASFEETGAKFLRITDIQNDSVNWDKVPYCSIKDSDFDKYRLIDGDIVFARTGATTGKSYLVRNPLRAVAASYLIRLRLNDPSVSPNFIAKYFQTYEYWNAISLGMSGSAQGGFNASKLSNLVVPIPSLREQKKIVEILDEALEGCDRAIRNTEKNLANARELFESYLNGIFTQKGDDWVEKKLEDVCTLQRGFDLPKRLRQKGVYPLVSSSGIIDSHVEAKVKRPGIATGRSGSIGNVFYIDDDFWPLNTVLYVKDFHDNNAEFIYYFLKYFDLSQYASGAGVPTLNRNHVHSIKVEIPRLITEQKIIVSCLNNLKEETQHLEAIYQRKLCTLQELKQSILHQAFTGQLTVDNGQLKTRNHQLKAG
ncbi:MAG: restriction endonuclease subunit S [Cyanobacteria bacterium SBLK]|nr:restriction endonuclease subunit S [Cyanobacteria bacterium SBLK]